MLPREKQTNLSKSQINSLVSAHHYKIILSFFFCLVRFVCHFEMFIFFFLLVFALVSIYVKHILLNQIICHRRFWRNFFKRKFHFSLKILCFFFSSSLWKWFCKWKAIKSFSTIENFVVLFIESIKCCLDQLGSGPFGWLEHLNLRMFLYSVFISTNFRLGPDTSELFSVGIQLRSLGKPIEFSYLQLCGKN